MTDGEHLATIHLQDGSVIGLYRQTAGLKVCRADHCFITPIQTAKDTIELYLFLEALGNDVTFPEVKDAKANPS